MFTIPFDEAASLETRLVGGKALGLAQMTQSGLPVAPGFTVSTAAYHQHLEDRGIRDRILDLLASADRESVEGLEAAAAQIRAWFDDGEFPASIRTDIARAYDELCARASTADISVAVRSSATAEDAAGASFAGEYDTFVGMRGIDEVALYVRRCWASAYTARSMAYAWKNGIQPTEVEMAVVVQKTVNARSAGVMFTLSPLSGDRSRIVIEAAYGLGLSVVGGEVTPDRYVVGKVGLGLVEQVLGEKAIEYIDGTTTAEVSAERRAAFCLSEEEAVALARLGKSLERQHGHPVDVEFAIDRDLPAGANLILLQCRPETYWSGRHSAVSAAPIVDAAQAVLANTLRHVRK
ncbi:PEP/pyruvate-binding domain-containing protein [Shinella sp. NM-101]|uniref:PEP/pyruvate-binding domain-containing protein n=1 Tax=Shinella sp. NM-101 TaxID=2744455 RepID=UPI001F33F7C5|nr:PEP/pyruvate-binding domain-containing protein [Shinella sp. NM-101]